MNSFGTSRNRRFLASFLLAMSISPFPIAAQDPARLRPRPAKQQPGSLPAWDLAAAAHLMRRAGFSAPLEELEVAVEQGFETTLQQLLHPELVDNSDLEKVVFDDRSPLRISFQDLPFEARRANRGAIRDDFNFRMINSKHQLVEKMTFFWHDHFATSVEGVPQTTLERIPLVVIQNRTLRKHALGNFRDFLKAMARDPALLRWLDNDRNRVGNPNENFARELMELFSLGLGHFTEEDVQEASRAFTGWTLNFDTGRFAFSQALHDHGEKTFMGVTGNLDGDDIIDIILEQAAAAEFIAEKLWEFLVYPAPAPEVVQGLGRVFRESDYEIRALLGALFRHPEFLSERARRALVKSPVEITLGLVREHRSIPIERLQILFALNQPLQDLREAQADAGQALYDPPDVGGWPSGLGWLNTSTLLNRYNYFDLAFAKRESIFIDENLEERYYILSPWLADIVDRHQLVSESDFVSHFLRRMVQEEVSADVRLALEEYMRRGPDGLPKPFGPGDPDLDLKIRGLVYLIATLPVHQLN